MEVGTEEQKETLNHESGGYLVFDYLIIKGDDDEEEPIGSINSCFYVESSTLSFMNIIVNETERGRNVCSIAVPLVIDHVVAMLKKVHRRKRKRDKASESLLLKNVQVESILNVMSFKCFYKTLARKLTDGWWTASLIKHNGKVLSQENVDELAVKRFDNPEADWRPYKNSTLKWSLKFV